MTVLRRLDVRLTWDRQGWSVASIPQEAIHLKLKLIAAGLAGALAVAGTASASSFNHGHGKKRFAVHTAHVSVGQRSMLGVAATYVGLDRAALLTQLKAGKSLAEVAVAQGKTSAGLVTALLAPAKLKLDAAVVAGKLTAAQETTILTNLTTKVTALVDRKLTPKTPTGKIRLGAVAILQPALSYLGLDFKALVSQLVAGKTLAQVAVAQGKTADGLVAAVVSAVKTKLDAQVTAGRITAAQETTFLTQLQTSVTAFVNGSH